MITRGKEYKARGEDAQARNIRKRRVCYVTAGVPTLEQKKQIERIEKGVVDGEWDGDPNHTMRNAEYMGIDFYEEEIRADGKWHRVDDPDVAISLMQTGAL